jgi:hypothetical protein
MQAEVGMRQLPKKDGAYFRQAAANNLQKLINKNNTSISHKSQHDIHEWKTMKSIKQKINTTISLSLKHTEGIQR